MPFDFAGNLADEVLREFLQKPAREELNNSTRFLSMMNRRRVPMQGNRIRIPIHIGRNVGVGVRRERGKMPASGGQQYDSAFYELKSCYATIELSGQAMSATEGSPEALLIAVDALTNEIRGAVKDATVDLSRQVWHDGSSFLTQCGVTATSNTVVVLSTKFLQVGLVISIRQSDDGSANVANRTVDAILTATTFTISGAAISTAITDSVYEGVSATDLEESRDSTSSGTWRTPLSVYGLEALVSEINPGRIVADGAAVGTHGFDQTQAQGQMGEIDRLAEPRWQANVVTGGAKAGGAAAILDEMQDAYDQSEIELGEETGLIMTSYIGRRRYLGLIDSSRRFMNRKDVDHGHPQRDLEFNDTPMVADRHASTANGADFEIMYFLEMQSLGYIAKPDWKWLDEDGSVLSRISRFDLWEATLKTYRQHIVDRPRANTLLRNAFGV